MSEISIRSIINSFNILLAAIFLNIPLSAWAISNLKNIPDNNLPTILKADQVDGSQKNQTISAKGNVEITKGPSKLIADEAIYDKKNKNITLQGDIVVNNLEIGKLKSDKAVIKDDFSNGNFENAAMIFKDGSYIKASKVEKVNPLSTIFFNPIYSFCPNDDISKDDKNIGKEKDFAVIQSHETKIDKKSGSIKSKHGVFKIYDIPILYTPYLSTPMSSRRRKTGFLFPSYTKNNKFGIGVRLPLYINIAEDKDLTLVPRIGLDGEKYLLTSEYRHLTSYGQYNLSLEAANNNIDSALNDNTIINRSNKNIRWIANGSGDFDLDHDKGFDFKINTMSDPNYLRDYQDNFLDHAISEINYDYIKNRDYFSIKSIRFQELENYEDRKQQQFVAPQINYELNIDPIFFKEKISIKNNLVAINRESGLQYNRYSLTPEILLPFNVLGNLIDIKFSVQNDLYLLDENYKYNEEHIKYKSTHINHRPKISLDWSLPLIKKTQKSTFLLEPIANFVSTRSTIDYEDLANEDSNNSELTFNNIFSDDHLSGYDRNENGQRFGYGVKSSLFNKFGEFSAGIGQSYRNNNEAQDVAIKGYSQSNKSNVVGQVSYKTKRNLSIYYSFHLNEANYRNDINEVSTNLNFDKISFSANYLLIRRSLQNEDKREQINFASSFKLYDRWNGQVSATKNIASGKILSKRLSLFRNGCCTNFGVYVVENSPENFNKAERTYGINLSFKNL